MAERQFSKLRAGVRFSYPAQRTIMNQEELDEFKRMYREKFGEEITERLSDGRLPGFLSFLKKLLKYKGEID